ncbi:thioester reductase domain-containing protein [Xenorhabdus budapestensis]|uniref:Linear gramicidin synthetase subunit B n=1 Tax=Xenorhabdus budapestensis TaxID=290110 RepID=A0A2D0IXG4_XENBU|nr:thioester reductase domain-containing protein [Xenorhabdus budapestensis]PHM26610.1 linear gramicidin synthetase subunit B [Xenorhabdus budapestensis]QTL41167.1 thioester reductase domain-containing protein [Xenorhabdus budapestensis]
MLNHTKKDTKNILVTGATGVMGGRVLLEVLTTTDASVYCLIRAENNSQALARLADFLFTYDQEKRSRDQLHRIIPVLGDITKTDLGLTAELYAELTGKIDRVIHCAAWTSLVASYGRLAPVNVLGTQNIIEFCLQGNIPMLYTSSFSVAGEHLYSDGFVLHETDLDVGQRFDDMDYERTKFESEQAVHRAGEKGLKWVIVRPGNIWGDSTDGSYPLRQTKVKGIYYEMIRALVETGLTFNSQEDFDISPVDYVAKAALYAILDIEKFNGKTLHLTAPDPITFNDIVFFLREFGYHIETVDNDDYMEALAQNCLYLNGKPYRSVFTDILALAHSGIEMNEKAKYATEMTMDLLSGSGIQCPPSDKTLLFRYFNYLIESDFIPPPQQQGEKGEIRKMSAQSGYLEHLFDADL